MYFYDAGPGLSSSAEVVNSVTGIVGENRVQDNDAVCYKALVALGGTDVHGPNATVAGCTADIATTSIQRSVGWHKLVLRADGQNYSLFIDDQQAFVVCLGRMASTSCDSASRARARARRIPSTTCRSADVGAAILPNLEASKSAARSGTIIGGTSAGERNVISGNANEGILVSGVTSTGTR